MPGTAPSGWHLLSLYCALGTLSSPFSAWSYQQKVSGLPFRGIIAISLKEPPLDNLSPTASANTSTQMPPNLYQQLRFLSRVFELYFDFLFNISIRRFPQKYKPSRSQRTCHSPPQQASPIPGTGIFQPLWLCPLLPQASAPQATCSIARLYGHPLSALQSCYGPFENPIFSHLAHWH